MSVSLEVARRTELMKGTVRKLKRATRQPFAAPLSHGRREVGGVDRIFEHYEIQVLKNDHRAGASL